MNNHSFSKHKENSKQNKIEKVYRKPEHNTHFAGEIPPVDNPNILPKSKNSEYKNILNQDKLSDKRNYLSFEDCTYEVPYDNMNDSLQNKAYLISSKKKLKPSAEFNQQDSLIKQEEECSSDLFRLNKNVLVDNQEVFDNGVLERSSGIFSAKLQPSIEDYSADGQNNKIHETEIQKYSERILDNVQLLKKLTKFGINDQDSFIQHNSADKFTISFHFDKLLIIKDDDEMFKILVLEPYNWLYNKRSEILINFHPGFAKLSSYGCIEITIIITLNHLNCSTIKYVFEKVSLDDRLITSQTFDVPFIKDENSGQDPIKKEDIPDESFILKNILYEDPQDDNEYLSEPKKVKPIKKTTKKINLKKFKRGPRGKYKKVSQKRKKGGGRKIMCPDLEDYVLERVREEVIHNGTMIERKVIKMLADQYVNSQQNDINHMASKGWLDKFMKRNGPMILELNNKLGNVIDKFCKKPKRASLTKLKRTTLKKKFEIKGTTKISGENSAHVLNQTIDNSAKQKIDKLSKKSLLKVSRCNSQVKIELPESHNDTFGTIKARSKNYFDDDSGHDQIFCSDSSD